MNPSQNIPTQNHDTTGTGERFDIKNDTVDIRTTSEVEICVPDSIDNLVCYVLKEQEQWLDEEARFVGRLITAKSRVIDIASNYGIYSLPIARVADRVWVFETNPVTIGCLGQGMLNNEVDNIAIIDLPLFGAPSRDDSPERIDSGLRCSLDPYIERFELTDIDFVRINISEESDKLIAQSRQFFELNSPLVMCGRHHDMRKNLRLVEVFAQRDYQPYCLIPGLDILAPIDDVSAIDSYLTNLFFCNKETAQALNRRNLLCTGLADTDTLLDDNTGAWEEYASHAIYTRPLLALWNSRSQQEFNTADPAQWSAYKQSLVFHRIAQNPVYPVNVRNACLYRAFQLLTETIDKDPTFSRLLTMARLSSELGLRDSAVQSLKVLLELLCSEHPVSADEPFLAVHPVFEQLDPGAQLGEWCFSSIFQTYSWLRSYSSFFSTEKELATLEEFKHTPFLQPRTERARQLLKLKLGIQSQPELNELLTLPSEFNLNPRLWV